MQRFGCIHCAFSGRTLRGKNNRSVTRARKPFLDGAAAIGTCQGSDREVHCRTTTLGLPCDYTPSGPCQLVTMNSPRTRKLKTRTRNWSRSVARSVIDKCSLLSIRSTFRVVYLSPAVFRHPQLARRLWNRLLYSGLPSPYSLSRCTIS